MSFKDLYESIVRVLEANLAKSGDSKKNGCAESDRKKVKNV